MFPGAYQNVRNSGDETALSVLRAENFRILDHVD